MSLLHNCICFVTVVVNDSINGVNGLVLSAIESAPMSINVFVNDILNLNIIPTTKWIYTSTLKYMTLDKCV